MVLTSKNKDFDSFFVCTEAPLALAFFSVITITSEETLSNLFHKCIYTSHKRINASDTSV